MKRKNKKKGNNLKIYLSVLVALAVSYVFGVYKQTGLMTLPNLAPSVVETKSLEREPEKKVSDNRTGEKSMTLPAPLKKRDEHILHHKGYVVSYNSDWKIPNWVAWELTSKETVARMEREDTFCEDPDFRGPQATLADYRRSGYSRGHMVPAADMRWDKKALEECFYLTNMCPQESAFNSGNWGKLERQCREWAKQYGKLWVVCGPIVGKNPKHIGTGKVVVPSAFYKVIFVPHEKNPRAIGFIFAHRNKKGAKLREFMTTVDEVEQRTGIDFFASLPKSIEKKVESQCIASQWRFFDEQKSGTRQNSYLGSKNKRH